MYISGRKNLYNPTTFVALASDQGLQNWLDSKSGQDAMDEFTRCFSTGWKVKVVTPQGGEYEKDIRGL